MRQNMPRLIMPALLFLVALAPADAAVLRGRVHYHDVDGRIGARVSRSGKVLRVHPRSPAANAGLRRGDQVVAVDGREGNVENIHGEPLTTVNLKVRREEAELSLNVMRVDYREIAP